MLSFIEGCQPGQIWEHQGQESGSKKPTKEQAPGQLQSSRGKEENKHHTYLSESKESFALEYRMVCSFHVYTEGKLIFFEDQYITEEILIRQKTD